MRKTIGILAHVDAGKTTLSEQILCLAGVLRAPGRVDHQDAFMDADALERRRGITIFSGQAVFALGGNQYTLLDTPGHADFSAEMERALQVLDAAILVVSCVEGVQSHTETVWRLCREADIPVLFFLNKTDREGADVPRTLTQIAARLTADCVLMDGGAAKGVFSAQTQEEIASRDEALLEAYLEGEADEAAFVSAARCEISQRRLFPAFAGSALRGEGVDALLFGLDALVSTSYAQKESEPFSARVFRVRRDAQGNRVTHMKILSGRIGVKEEIACLTRSGEAAREKVHELRIYHGEKSRPVSSACAGEVVAATGLSSPLPGERIGDGMARSHFDTRPMLRARVLFDASVSHDAMLSMLRELEQEDPALAVNADAESGDLEVSVMGPIQLEVLSEIFAARFGLNVRFGESRILYLETIEESVMGVGHYEPLRHYAEVQLRLSPGQRGSGITFDSVCPVDTLALNWQRLIGTHVLEKAHRGVLTGAPATDIHITLITGRAHLKHTEGGDFREATYRAIRQGLMQAKSVLLEPVCRFFLSFPDEFLGRMLSDLTRLCADFEPPQSSGGVSVVEGFCPAATFMRYPPEFTAATRGRGAVSYRLSHYAPCANAQEVIERAAYNPLASLADTPDSVFCSHGAGYNVSWQDAPGMMHCAIPERPAKAFVP